MKIKVSVIIPIYNMSQFLIQCLNSVFDQTIEDIEIITVNDGSTDKSLSILEEYALMHNNMIVITQKNKGSGSARNRGIECANGKYLIFMDPDDYYPSNDCLEALYNSAEKNGAFICGGIVMRNDGVSRSETDDKTVREFYQNGFFSVGEYTDIYSHQRFLFRTDMIKENNISYPLYRRFQDPPFLLKAMICAREIYGIDKVVYEYRVAHKQIKYSFEICRDILCSIRDCFKMVKDNDLNQIWENRLRNIHKEYIIPFYKYSFCGYKEIDELINEINAFQRQMADDTKSILLTAESVKQVRKDSVHEFEIMKSVLYGEEKKIIYGAGAKTHNLLRKYHDKMNNILGIAVSEISNVSSNTVSGYEVKRIENYQIYNKDATVIIATVTKYQDEIEQNLKRLGFQNILKLDMCMIELAEAINDCM